MIKPKVFVTRKMAYEAIEMVAGWNRYGDVGERATSAPECTVEQSPHD